MLTVADCEETVLQAIYKANERYAHWSGGSWVSDAGVESVICHEIADEFARHAKRGKWKIGLEMSYATIEEWSGTERRPGRPPDLLRGLARADVVLLDGRWRPMYVIEVKRSWNAQAVYADGKRINTIMRRCGKGAEGSLKAGFLAMFNVRQPRARRDKDMIADRQKEVAKELATKGLKVGHRAGDWMIQEFDDGEWSCQGICYSLS